MPKPRIWPIDFFRGLALVNMLAYHFMYDWVYIFGLPAAWYRISAPGCHIWQQYICWSFILLSGYSWHLARRPLKNGLVVAGCAALLTAVTVLALPSEAIWWGVLHLNACAVLLTVGLRPLLDKIPPLAGFLGAAVLFLLTNQLPYGYMGFERRRLAALPPALYKANLFWLVLPDLTRFASADYFPLVPWLFLFWAGWYAARLWPPRAPQKPAPAALRPLCAVGRRSLFVYMLHQPLIYGGLWAGVWLWQHILRG